MKLGKIAALLCTASIVAAACGSSSKTSSSSSTTAASGASTTAAATTTAAASGSSTTAAAATTTAAAATTTAAAGGDVLGTPKAASGTSVKIGYFYDGQSVAIDNTEDWLSAQATMKYVNDYLGGIGGRPLELVVCDGKQDAAISTDCGNQFVQKGVAAVLFDVSGQASSMAKPVLAAKVPIFAFASTVPEMMAKDVPAFILANPLAGLGAFPATVAGKNKFTKAAILVTDVPAAVGPANAVGGPALKAAGVTAPDVVAIAPTVADFGPAVQAELKKEPQLVHLIGNATFCTAAINALRDADFKGIITGISNCFDAASIKNLAGKMAGIQVSYAAGEDPTNKDYQTYLAVLKKYAAGAKINTSGTPVGSFAIVVALARVMANATGDITPASVTATIKGAPALPVPTLAGATFKCDGSALPAIPTVCNTQFAVGTLDANGKVTFGS